MHAARTQSRDGAPLPDPHAIDVDRQGADFRPCARDRGRHVCRPAGRRDPHLLSRPALATACLGLRLRNMPGLPFACRWIRQVGVDAMTTTERGRRDEGIIFVALFALTIPAANWMIGHVGTVCQPTGPCLVPVGPGLMAPSGVTMAGAALVLRDLVQRRLGVTASSLAILAGAVLSALLAPPALVIASAAAFLLSEFADLAVYTPLARRGLIIAVVASGVVGLVVASGVVGLVVDSVVFLWLAFGSLEFLLGQIIGKAWMVLLSIPCVVWLRRRDAAPRHGAGLRPRCRDIPERCAHERRPLRDFAGDYHRDYHHDVAEKRDPPLLDERAAAARSRRRAHRRPCLHLAFRAGA